MAEMHISETVVRLRKRDRHGQPVSQAPQAVRGRRVTGRNARVAPGRSNSFHNISSASYKRCPCTRGAAASGVGQTRPKSAMSPAIRSGGAVNVRSWRLLFFSSHSPTAPPGTSAASGRPTTTGTSQQTLIRGLRTTTPCASLVAVFVPPGSTVSASGPCSCCISGCARRRSRAGDLLAQAPGAL
jgi:hypothetical protein